MNNQKSDVDYKSKYYKYKAKYLKNKENKIRQAGGSVNNHLQ